MNFCSKYGFQTYFKGNRRPKNIIVSTKDKDPMEWKSWIIYWCKFQELECNNDYIGKSAQLFGEKFKEHLKASWPIHGHPTTICNFSIVGSERQGFARTIKECIFIRVNNPTLKNTLVCITFLTFGLEF